MKIILNKDIEVLDLTKRLRKTAEIEKAFLYYKKDPHYNKAGYFAVGRIIAEHLRRYDLP